MKALAWTEQSGYLKKRFDFRSYTDLTAFAGGPLTDLADAMNHHPDFRVHEYRFMTVELTTHEKGEVTDLDRQMATKIDEQYGVWCGNKKP